MVKINEGERIGREQWEENWQGESRWQHFIKHRVFTRLALNYQLNLLFKKYLTPGNKKLLDIGCGGGKWLVYFKKQFGFDVYGLDYAEKACGAARETLRYNKVEGKILCGDIFDGLIQKQYRDYFDVVMSMGVIEHFDNPTAIIQAHLKLLKPGGYLIITIPNYGNGSIYRKAQKLFGHEEELVKGHNVSLMETANLRQYVQKLGNVKIEELDYIGGLSIVNAPWPPRLSYALYPLSELISYATLLLHSRTLSPVVAFVGRKYSETK